MGKRPGSEVFDKVGAENQALAAPSSPGQTLDSEPPGWWVLLGGSARGCTSSPVALSGFEPGQFVGSAGQRLLSRDWQIGFPREKRSLFWFSPGICTSAGHQDSYS